MPASTRGCFSECVLVQNDHKSIALEIIRLSLAQTQIQIQIPPQAEAQIQIQTEHGGGHGGGEATGRTCAGEFISTSRTGAESLPASRCRKFKVPVPPPASLPPGHLSPLRVLIINSYVPRPGVRVVLCVLLTFWVH